MTSGSFAGDLVLLLILGGGLCLAFLAMHAVLAVHRGLGGGRAMTDIGDAYEEQIGYRHEPDPAEAYALPWRIAVAGGRPLQMSSLALAIELADGLLGAKPTEIEHLPSGTRYRRDAAGHWQEVR